MAATTVALTGGRENNREGASALWRYVVSPLSTWDGGWYVRIARHGYDQQEASAAFWPLFPFLLSVGHSVTGWSYEMVGVVLSNIFFLWALIVLFSLIGRTYGDWVARRAVWLAALSPLAFFFSAVYTESLFLLLTVGALSLADSSRWTGATLIAALATLTRNSGVLILLPLAMTLFQQRDWKSISFWTRGGQIAAAGLTPALFAAHLDRIWGDPLLSVRVQEQWGRTRDLPWNTVADAVHRMHRIYATGRHSCDVRPNGEAFHSCRAAFQLTEMSISDDLSFLFVMGSLLVLPYAFWSLMPRDSIYLAAGIILPLLGPTTYDPLASMARYVLVLFPLYIVVALLLRWRPLFVAVLGVSAASMAGLLAMFAQRYFVA